MTYRNPLYGDGVHDDTAAIQERIDSGLCELVLPAPAKHYLISRPLELPSNFRLVLPRFAEVRLAKGANCLMLKNRLTPDKDAPSAAEAGYPFVNYITRFEKAAYSENIEVTGGIWNANNREQAPNPIYTHDESILEFWGYAFLFFKVRGLKLSAMTFKDPSNYAVTLDRVSYFTVEDITFDFNYGNPVSLNMDGIHLDGNCHFGRLANLRGACRDDLVALNAHEGSCGPITNITVEGIYAEGCHSAVRLLSATAEGCIENVHISDVYGTYYQYCIGITNFYYVPGERGTYRNITLENIYASKATRRVQDYPWPDSYVYAPIWFDKCVRVENMKVETLHRTEQNNPIPTFLLSEESEIGRLILSDVTTENRTAHPMPFFQNDGKITHLILRDVFPDEREESFIGQGTYGKTEYK